MAPSLDGIHKDQFGHKIIFSRGGATFDFTTKVNDTITKSEQHIDWQTDEFDLDKARKAYATSTALQLLAFSCTVLLILALIITTLLPPTKKHFRKKFAFLLSKLIVIALGCTIFVESFLCWTLFLLFNSSLEDSGLFEGPARIMCDHFSGHESKDDFKAEWGPLAGWDLLIIASTCAMIATILSCTIKRNPLEPSERPIVRRSVPVPLQLLNEMADATTLSPSSSSSSSSPSSSEEVRSMLINADSSDSDEDSDHMVASAMYTITTT